MSDFNNLEYWMMPLIVKNKLTVETLARKVKVSRSAIYAYFTDRNRPTSQTMLRICHVLGVPFEEGLSQYSPRKRGRPFRTRG